MGAFMTRLVTFNKGETASADKFNALSDAASQAIENFNNLSNPASSASLGAFSLSGANSTVQAELNKRTNSVDLAASNGATQVGATSLTGASSTVQAELSKKPDSTNLAASNGAASIGALDDTGSANTVQGALALKVAATTLAGTGAGNGANIVGYKSALAGAVARTIQSKFSEFVSVKDFGAVGDGVADDTAAITAAITVGQNTNWMVYFPPGDYVISSVINVNLDVKTQLVLMGAGEHVTKIKVAGASQNFLAVTGNFGNYWLDSVTPNGSFTMSNMTVSCWGGVDNSGTAISMNMGSQLGRPNKGIRFTNVSFKSEVGFFAYSVSLRNCAQINFDTCRFFSGNGVQSGIGILGQCDSGQDGGGMFINNCEFFYFLHGIYTKDRFEGNYVTSSAFINCQYGFTSVVGSESGVLITNSEFDCMVEGIHLEGMYDFVITGNCFLSQDADGQIAISVKNGSGFTITGNKIEGTSPTTGTGILLENTDDTLTRASYVGSNSIANCNIAMQITNCSNITFGPWAWKSCTLDTNAGGTNTYIQQGCYEKNTTIVKTLSGSTAAWTITIDISDMRLTRTPKFANLVSQSTPNMIAQYNYAASSNTSVVFIVTLGNGGTIAANPYRFGLSIRQPYFDI